VFIPISTDIGASMPMVWEYINKNQPYFPEEDYQILKMDVLQVCSSLPCIT